MVIDLQRSEDGATVFVRGRLTASVAARLRAALLDAFEGSRRVELALRDVEEADLTFLQLVCAAHRTAAERSCAFSVSGLDRAEAVCRLVREAGASRADDCLSDCPCEPEAAPAGSPVDPDRGRGEAA